MGSKIYRDHRRSDAIKCNFYDECGGDAIMAVDKGHKSIRLKDGMIPWDPDKHFYACEKCSPFVYEIMQALPEYFVKHAEYILGG